MGWGGGHPIHTGREGGGEVAFPVLGGPGTYLNTCGQQRELTPFSAGCSES